MASAHANALDVETQFLSNWTLTSTLTQSGAALNTDALRGGPSLRDEGRWVSNVRLATDRRRAFSMSTGYLRRRDDAGASYDQASGDGTIRPAPRLLITVQPSVERFVNDAQFIGRDALAPQARNPLYVVGRLHLESASLTTRIAWVLSQSLEVQAYAQPLLSAARYDGYKIIRAPRAAVFADRFLPVRTLEHTDSGSTVKLDRDDDGRADAHVPRRDFTRRDFAATATLRWEYRAGSTLHFAWNRQRALSDSFGTLVPGRDLSRLVTAPGKDVFAVKLAYWLAR